MQHAKLMRASEDLRLKCRPAAKRRQEGDEERWEYVGERESI
jgi:hypothetical protein